MASLSDVTAGTRERFSDVISQALGRYSLSILGVLRHVKPIISTRAFGVVTRADDVREVLSDFEHFGVTAYNERMTEISGPFILGLDNTDLYRRDHHALRAVIRHEDLPALAERTLSIARAHVAASSGSFDVVRELADPTIDAVMSEYLGTPGPNHPTQLRWARDIFTHVFLNVSNKSTLRQQALAAAAEMRPHLDAQIAMRRRRLDAAEKSPDDVLTRLLEQSAHDGGLRDISVRHNLIGIIAGWIPTVSKAFACAIDEILARPEVLRRVRAAARAHDHELVWQHMLEALRFQPQTWALLRTCVANQTVATGTRRAAMFHSGATVLIATQSAMFDSSQVSDPREFRVGRPPDTYLHFGHGLHTCFGKAINRIHLPAMAIALFEGPPVSRPPGRGRAMVYHGAYPASLPVQFRPEAPA